LAGAVGVEKESKTKRIGKDEKNNQDPIKTQVEEENQ